jgi:hypothetical protein
MVQGPVREQPHPCSTSLLINSAGVQLDANMDDFRFPPELR